jgi:molybdopterin/thiamine biosynthesis adenylyltransferase
MPSRLRELHRTLSGLGFTRDGSVTEGVRYTGSIQVSGRTIRSAILLDDPEFARLPRLHLLAPAEDVPELLAHVQKDGEYCYAHRDAIVLDRFAIPGAIALSVQLMRSSLERSLTSHAKAEIEAEFPQHWFGHTIYVDLKSPSADRTKLYRIVRADKSELDVLADSQRVVSLMSGGQEPSEHPAAVVRTLKPLTFARGQTRPETFADFLRWLSSIDAGASDRALSACQASYPKQPHLFVVAPNGTIGIRLEFMPAVWKSFQRPQALIRYVDKHRKEVKLMRFAGEPVDPQYIYTRNTDTQPNLSGKRIALIGCGTIGSHLAKMLAQSGAGFGKEAHLHFIDQQVLTAGNVGRHLLGVPDIGRPKATAVRDTLLRLYPELNVSGTVDDALKHLCSLDQSDLVIDATGDEGVTNAVNAHFVDRRKSGCQTPATIFTWLFGNGAAAQALCVTSSEDACYRCLRADHGGQWRFDPLKPSYARSEVPARCGEGPFFPYGVAAPVTAAALALQLALDWRKGDPSPRLRTQRLAFDGTKQVRDHDPARLSRCPACNTEH